MGPWWARRRRWGTGRRRRTFDGRGRSLDGWGRSFDGCTTGRRRQAWRRHQPHAIDVAPSQPTVIHQPAQRRQSHGKQSAQHGKSADAGSRQRGDRQPSGWRPSRQLAQRRPCRIGNCPGRRRQSSRQYWRPERRFAARRRTPVDTRCAELPRYPGRWRRPCRRRTAVNAAQQPRPEFCRRSGRRIGRRRGRRVLKQPSQQCSARQWFAAGRR
jgi:hypothetical protein